ncbi:Peptidase M50B-like-domain containing protein [Rhodotorula toruloides]|uniref:Peptidase M50B-like-domain containing protein n=1 Tax=Rhodotorula toruloides TaxID=5286 RepID=A0A2T0A885_RHOTO|nr:Peptidase M50B-like-domain containing protein [Rhodotorula toruloides]
MHREGWSVHGDARSARHCRSKRGLRLERGSWRVEGWRRRRAGSWLRGRVWRRQTRRRSRCSRPQYAVVITVLWNLPVVRWVLWPWKMLTIAFHEFGHAATGCCTGAKVKSIELDPREGGVTMMAGGVGWITLPAGYLGSSLIGALLIFCGFTVVASKIASIVVGVCFLITLWWSRRDWLSILTILVATGLIVAFWFIAHGEALRYYMLWLGMMSGLYSIYDICDDLIFRKVNESDASVFAKRYGGSSVCWGVIWGIVSLLFMAVGIIAGLAAFKSAGDGAKFLPTRF